MGREAFRPDTQRNEYAAAYSGDNVTTVKWVLLIIGCVAQMGFAPPPEGRTTDETALLRAIVAHPKEDTPRLAYADWLDENGHPKRAEFIRLQIELSLQTTPNWKKVARMKDLSRDPHATGIPPELEHPAGVHIGFERGFPEELHVDYSVFIQRGDSLLKASPFLRKLHILETRSTSSMMARANHVVRTLVDSDVTRQLTTLSLVNVWMTSEDVEALEPKLTALVDLTVSDFDVVGLPRLFHLPLATRLERLETRQVWDQGPIRRRTEELAELGTLRLRSTSPAIWHSLNPSLQSRIERLPDSPFFTHSCQEIMTALAGT